MRVKLILSLLAMAALAFFGYRYFSNQNKPATSEAETVAPALPTASLPHKDLERQSEAPPTEPANTNNPANDPALAARGSVAEHGVYVEKRVAELQDLAMDDDPKSLQIILSELTNREPEIRHAAVDAAVQFGSRDAIPLLSDAALQTDDAEERASMLSAAEYLKLPSYRETKDEPVAAKPAAKKTRTWRLVPAANTPR